MVQFVMAHWCFQKYTTATIKKNFSYKKKKKRRNCWLFKKLNDDNNDWIFWPNLESIEICLFLSPFFSLIYSLLHFFHPFFLHFISFIIYRTAKIPAPKTIRCDSEWTTSKQYRSNRSVVDKRRRKKKKT